VARAPFEVKVSRGPENRDRRTSLALSPWNLFAAGIPIGREGCDFSRVNRPGPPVAKAPKPWTALSQGMGPQEIPLSKAPLQRLASFLSREKLWGVGSRQRTRFVRHGSPLLGICDSAIPRGPGGQYPARRTFGRKKKPPGRLELLKEDVLLRETGFGNQRRAKAFLVVWSFFNGPLAREGTLNPTATVSGQYLGSLVDDRGWPGIPEYQRVGTREPKTSRRDWRKGRTIADRGFFPHCETCETGPGLAWRSPESSQGSEIRCSRRTTFRPARSRRRSGESSSPGWSPNADP